MTDRVVVSDVELSELSEKARKKIANDALDRDVYALIRSPLHGVTLSFLVCMLCRAKGPRERDIDRSLQRLRKGGAIRFVAGEWVRLLVKEG